MLRILGIGKTFGSQSALTNVNLDIREGEFFSLLGPSGCGKTTLLRIIAGFETPTTGKIFWDDIRVDGIKPQDRPFNMVFQRYALFPHLNVFNNVAYGLRVKGVDKATMVARVNEALELVGLSDFSHRMPETLSGGQAQRVAVARSVVNKPKILLLDEPLSALDQKMREHMQTELRELQRRVGITFIFVTHDQQEAITLSDRIAVMNKGQLEQVSTPQELYHNPKTLFVAQFIGSSGSLPGQMLTSPGVKGLAEMKWDGYTLKGQERTERTIPPQAPSVAVIRPERIQVAGQGRTWGAHLDSDGKPVNKMHGHVHSSVFKGAQTELLVDLPLEQKLRVVISDPLSAGVFHPGLPVELRFSALDTHIFPASPG